MRLTNILRGVTTCPQASSEIIVNGINLNSKFIKTGYIFVAIGGNTNHGNQFITEAIHNGAIVILTDKKINNAAVTTIYIDNLTNNLSVLANNFYKTARHKKIIAITGTNGKTSVASFLHQTLNCLQQKTKVIGTLTNDLTTPNIFSLYAELDKFNGNYVVLEVSSHALIQKRVAGLNFILAIWTNLSHEHLDYHQNMDNYLQAKLLICNQSAYGIFNKDSSYYKYFTAKINYDSYSLAELNFSYREFGFLCNLDNIIFELNILGEFNLYNVLAVYKSLLYLGFDKLSIVKSIAQLSSPPGRMQKIDNHDIFIDFAHTPDALTNSLLALKNHIPHKKITIVFGCGGDRDKTKRSIMGKIASNLAQNIIITDDNPRTEDPNIITDDIISGVSGNCTVVHDRALAIKSALVDKNKYAILIAGKGHENYQLIKNKKLYFSDHETLLELVKNADSL